MESSTFTELLDTLSFWAVNFTSAFMLSAAHNVLYFVLDWHTSIFHFLHFGCTFIFLFARLLFHRMTGGDKRDENFFLIGGKSGGIPVRVICETIYPAIFGQLTVTALTAQVYSQNRAGELYLLRIFDFLATIVAIKVKPKLLECANTKYSKQVWSLLLPVAIAGSLSWLEFGHIEFDHWSLLLAPVLAVAQGIQFVLVKRASINFENLEAIKGDPSSFEQFSFCYTGIVTAILAIPAMISYSHSVVSYDASWESIDYILMSMSVVFMAAFKYSELWLLTHLKLHHFCALEHAKYFMGSCGQWFLQNMAHASVYAGCGKLLFTVAALRYWINFGISTSPRKQSES